MLVRLPIAMILGVATYLVAMAMTVYDGLLSLVLQPIAGAFLTGCACVTLLVVGAPLLLSSLWRLWCRLWPVPLALAVGGMVSMLASWHPALRIVVWNPDWQTSVESFHPGLAMGGWVAMLFGVLWCPKISFTRDGRWA